MQTAGEVLFTMEQLADLARGDNVAPVTAN